MCPVITGLGLVTPLGASADATWRALLDGQFIKDHARLGPIASLADTAARQAIHEARWTDALIESPQTALVVGTSKGDAAQASSLWLSTFNHRLEACATTGGPRTTLSAACASGLHALIHASLLLRGGPIQRVLVIAAEASVHPLFLASFQRLGVLAPAHVGCRPFDRQRKGFLMSEAAAAVCLEKPENATGRGIAVVDRFALGADAHHLTGGDPQGRVLRRMIAQVVAGEPVDLVHAHGTGTMYNDATELAAIEAEVRGSPILYSHKGALGHSLGASGLVSIVLNCLSHRHGRVPPNVQTRDPLPSRLLLSRDPVHRPIRRSLALAAGFGGAVAAVGLVGGVA